MEKAIECDDCGRRIYFRIGRGYKISNAELAEEARSRGWTCGKNRDLCSGCRQNRELNPKKYEGEEKA